MASVVYLEKMVWQNRGKLPFPSVFAVKCRCCGYFSDDRFLSCSHHTNSPYHDIWINTAIKRQIMMTPANLQWNSMATSKVDGQGQINGRWYPRWRMTANLFNSIKSWIKTRSTMIKFEISETSNVNFNHWDPLAETTSSVRFDFHRWDSISIAEIRFPSLRFDFHRWDLVSIAEIFRSVRKNLGDV